MRDEIHFVGISGSLRRGSFNTQLLNSTLDLLPDGVTMEIAGMGDLPLYNADLETDGLPESVRKFRETLSRADAFVFVSPEYNYSVPGTLKNAIDWASRAKDSPLSGKPVALMGATQGMWGTVRMQIAFRPIFQFLNMTPVNKPEVLVAQAQSKFDASGHLADEPTIAIVRQQLAELKKLAKHTKIVKELTTENN
ncbi:MAG: NAD(P)H-dependent oxidoreductase [Bacteroidetes bacterium]|nr:NAD(P)H-dependent oxidoreductase [Bacteroidota bacterium]